MEERLPVFVYGTLRKGEGNYGRFLAGRTDTEYPALLSGHVLLADGLPFVVPMDGFMVRGDLMEVREEEWASTLRELDRLEGFRADRPDTSLYVRTRRTVVYGNEDEQSEAEAWVYLGGGLLLDGVKTAEASIVHHGDWVRFNEERRHAA